MIDAVRQLSIEEQGKNHPYRVGGVVSLPKTWAPSRKATYSKDWIFFQGEFDGNNDECGGCALAMAIAVREGRPIDPHFSWMMARERGGSKLSEYGIGNADLAMTSVKAGSLLKEDGPFTFKDGRDKIATPSNWDLARLRPLAWPQISGSIVWIKPEGGMDAFDVFCSSITKFDAMYRKEHAAVFGFLWDYDNNAHQLEAPVENGSGHDMACIGWDGDYAILIQSGGLGSGDQGEVRFHRSIINRWAVDFGMFIPIDATREQINAVIASGGKLDNFWFMNILLSFKNALSDLLAKLNSHATGIFA